MLRLRSRVKLSNHIPQKTSVISPKKDLKIHIWRTPKIKRFKASSKSLIANIFPRSENSLLLFFIEIKKNIFNYVRSKRIFVHLWTNIYILYNEVIFLEEKYISQFLLFVDLLKI